jgi:hypothetical protein
VPSPGSRSKDYRKRPLDFRRRRQKRVDFEARQVRRPRQRSHVIQQDVAYVRAAFAARHRESLNPFRRESRGVFFVEVRGRHAVRVALERDGVLADVRQQVTGNAHVIFDRLALVKPDGYIGFSGFEMATLCPSISMSRRSEAINRASARQMPRVENAQLPA